MSAYTFTPREAKYFARGRRHNQKDRIVPIWTDRKGLFICMRGMRLRRKTHFLAGCQLTRDGKSFMLSANDPGDYLPIIDFNMPADKEVVYSVKRSAIDGAQLLEILEAIYKAGRTRKKAEVFSEPLIPLPGDELIF
jgi:hypothetical protein